LSAIAEFLVRNGPEAKKLVTPNIFRNSYIQLIVALHRSYWLISVDCAALCIQASLTCTGLMTSTKIKPVLARNYALLNLRTKTTDVRSRLTDVLERWQENVKFIICNRITTYDSAAFCEIRPGNGSSLFSDAGSRRN